MRISDRFIMALRNLSRRKSRTILTILSVVIGSTSIILMLAFAQGISASQRQMIESFQGLTTINIYNETGELKVDDQMLREMGRIDHVKAVVPSKDIFANMLVDEGDEYEMDGSLMVFPDDTFKLIDQDMMEFGQVPNPADEYKILLSKSFEVMGASNGDSMYGPGYEPVKDFDYTNHTYTLRLGWEEEEEDDGVNFGNEDPANPDSNKPTTIDIPVEIAGKLNNKSFLDGWGSYISETTYKALKKEDEKLASPTMVVEFDQEGNPIPSKDDKIAYDNLSVIADDPENVEAVENEIRQLGYQTNSMAGANEEIEGQTRTVMLILGGIGSIAFIVSAIGIINTMLMSIYERQKEIGVMKVIGASIADIQAMFLIESGFIGFFGGILGLVISLLIGKAINGLFASPDPMMGMTEIIIIPAWLALVGVGFSALVGVLAGFLPARRATKLSAIDALRAN